MKNLYLSSLAVKAMNMTLFYFQWKFHYVSITSIPLCHLGHSPKQNAALHEDPDIIQLLHQVVQSSNYRM